MEGDVVNQEDILAVLPDSRDDAKSLKEIAQDMEMEMEMASYANWIRVERRLSSSLRALARWGFVALEKRQREEGHKFWYNAYWKNKPIGEIPGKIRF
jgi:predicted transcriptional regulator